ncbi:MAG: RluA family pseudouridine synthase [Bacteroidaceae bacterium]|nr:RluA family pseudouridine synthase [Bacteroidaceae bacterium]
MKRPSNYTPFIVQPADHGTELLPFLMKCLDGASRTKVKGILSGGGVRVDGMNTTQFDLVLARGQRVEISKAKPLATLNNRYVRLVYEDHHLLVVEKQPGILSMATRAHSFCVKTLLDDYLHKCHRKCTAHVVHRLDRDTSGLMVYAKTMEAERILEEHWHEIVTDRRYVALVSGRMERQKGSVESWLKENKAFFTYSSHVPDDGKYALTHYRVLQADNRHTLVELQLETGRKNQIRVHMQDLGHPVCGDPKYGGHDDNPCRRLCLHAFRLFLRHPVTGEPLRFETPIPKAFREVMQNTSATR